MLLDIGVDLDETIYPLINVFGEWLEEEGWDCSNPLPQYNYFEGYTKDGQNMTAYDFHRELAHSIRSGCAYSAGDPYPGTENALVDLAYRGHRLHVVTARLIPGAYHESVLATHRWLAKLNVPFSSIIINKNKSVIETDLFIDDATHNLVNLRNAGISAIAMNQPWNKDWDGPGVNNILEFRDIVLEVAENLDKELSSK